MKSRDCEMQEMFTHSHRNYSQFYIEGKQQLYKFKPSLDLPIVRTAAALRAMFWLGFPWARSHKTPDMERPLVPYPKRSIRPCLTGNNELCRREGLSHGMRRHVACACVILRFCRPGMDISYLPQAQNPVSFDTCVQEFALPRMAWRALVAWHEMRNAWT